MENQRNVLGGQLKPCSKFPMTGFFRDGHCRTCEEDVGMHTVCVEITDDFLRFSRSRGNDLSTPVPEYDFPGLIAGDYWCLCAVRWLEAFKANMAPRVVLSATNQKALEIVSLEDLKAHAVNEPNGDFPP